MSSAARAGVRERYGSRWMATLRPKLAAAEATSTSRSCSGDPKPHQETTTVSTPLPAISRMCPARTFVFDDEYRPRVGKYGVESTALPSRSTYQCSHRPSRTGVEYHG